MKLIIIGYYGKNLGDILMLKVLTDYFLARDFSISVITYGDPDEDTLNFIGNNIKFTKILKSYSSLYQVVSLLKNAKAIIWGGGTCFMDEGGDGGIKYMLIAKAIGVRVLYLGIGIGQIKKVSTQVKLNLAKLISSRILVRDTFSRGKLGKIPSYKVDIAPDLVYGLSDYISSLKKNIVTDYQNDNRLLIAYRNVEEYFGKLAAGYYLENFIKRVREFCIIHHVSQIIVIDVDNDVDQFNSNHIYESLKMEFSVCRNKAWSLNEKLDLILSSTYVFTGRLHVGMLAYLMKKPFVLFNYSPKNKYFVSEIGADQFLIDYSDFEEKNCLSRAIEHVYCYEKNSIEDKRYSLFRALERVQAYI